MTPPPLLAAELKLRHVHVSDAALVSGISRVCHISGGLTVPHQFLIGHQLDALPKIFNRELGFGNHLRPQFAMRVLLLRHFLSHKQE
jgi:hypothetical protein